MSHRWPGLRSERLDSLWCERLSGEQLVSASPARTSRGQSEQRKQGCHTHEGLHAHDHSAAAAWRLHEEALFDGRAAHIWPGGPGLTGTHVRPASSRTRRAWRAACRRAQPC